MDYKKEDLKFFNMSTTKKYVSGANSRNGYYDIFKIENELTREEKIQIIDEFENGIATYMLGILNKWDKEKEGLPKERMGNIKTISMKAWLKRNDTKKIISNEYSIGTYYLFQTKFISLSLICPTTEYGHSLAYTNDDVVNQWFHDLCKRIYRDEKEYFKSINPVDIKIDKIREFSKYISGTFDSRTLNDIIWNNKEDVSEEELDIYIEAYEKIDKYMKEIEQDVKQKLESIE